MENSELKQLWEEVKNLLSKIYSGSDLEEVEATHLSALDSFESEEDAILYLTEVRNKLKSRKKAWVWVLGVLAFLVVAIGAIWLVGSMSQSGDSKSSAQSSAPSTTQTSNSSTTPTTQLGGVEPFEILPEGANVEGKIISNNSSSNSLEGPLQQKVDTILYGAQHSLDDLQQGVKVWAIDVPKNIKWTEEKNGKTFLSREAQLLYYKYEEKLREFAKPEEVTNVAVSGYATGSQKGELVQDSTLRSYEGWSGVKFTYTDSKGDTYAVYYLDYCGNIVTPGHVVKKVAPLPIPPQQPTPPTPPSQTPPPAAKDPKQDPAAQGQAPVGGGQNADGTVSEAPSETTPSFSASYQAPAEQPATTTPSTGGAGAATTPSTAIVNAPSGSFSDGNGTTTVSGSGAIITPGGAVWNPTNGSTPKEKEPPVQGGVATDYYVPED